ncbi:unnamed protein product [Albugo candida]|uniref:Uncharacterized protein n=1 Tax=Albugo candida TaxID=65357 RepID=A0A024GUM9_9STRA|nr:unnamed protein product [Albugo candida]|eukprot:CCI50067.1 unnamed protein product [Albugo candida]
MSSDSRPEISGVKAAYRSGDIKIYEYGEESPPSQSTNEKEQNSYGFSSLLDGGDNMPPLKQTTWYSELITSIQSAKEDSEIFFKGVIDQK